MKSQNKIPRRSRGVSPVIATVILVAVAITVAVAVSYWMSGISSQYTSFEKVEIQTAVCVWDSTKFDWVIEIKLKNSGTATATLIAAFINDLEVDVYDFDYAGSLDAANATTSMTQQESMKSGGSTTIYIYIDGPGDGAPETTPATPEVDYWQSVSSGTTVNIKLHSAAGMDYIKLVQLV